MPAFISRRRRRDRGAPSNFFGSNARAIVLFLSLPQQFHDSCAWTAPKTPMLLRTSFQPTKSLPGKRKRPITCLRESPVAITIDKVAASNSIDATNQGNQTTNGEPITDKETGEEPMLAMSAWEILAGNVATCLIASDQKRAKGMDGGSTGWTSWIEESSSFRLQQCVDRLVFGETETEQNASIDGEKASGYAASNRDETMRWLNWMKASPSPMVVELSGEFRQAVDSVLTQGDLERASMKDPRSRADFLSRIGCRMVLLPSGSSLRDNIQTPPGAMVYGKLLYGGVTRYRIIGGAGNNGGRRPPRRAGERTTIMPLREDKHAPPPISKGWLQYGGPDRNYNALDMGPCGLMEVTILPKDLKLGLLSARESSALEAALLDQMVPETEDDDESGFDVAPTAVERQPTDEMVVSQADSFDPQWLFSFPPETTANATEVSKNETSGANQTFAPASGDHGSVNDIEERFSTVLGGLQPEIQSIIRRVLDGRQTTSTGGTSSELQTMLDFGLSPVKGLLLYGVPGCGKTALAREISRLLTDRPTKIVAAPELLDRWVGGTESSVRSLFADAEAELQVCNGDPTKSGLHVIVIDEIDAVFRQRSSSSGSGEVARASAVNQILAKLDGVQALGNTLLIGTTNRRELLDNALLRPGRLEVKIEVPLPDREGRREILDIYFGPLRSKGRLSKPLCRAIDGSRRSPPASTSSSFAENGRSRMRSFLSERLSWKASGSSGVVSMHDLASDRWTGGFSGADIEGLVRCAGSLALSRARKDGSGVGGLLITTEDVAQAIRELKQ